MAERSKALRSGRSLVLQAWVRIPLLTSNFRLIPRSRRMTFIRHRVLVLMYLYSFFQPVKVL